MSAINPGQPNFGNDNTYTPNKDMADNLEEALAYKLGINMTTKLQELEASANAAVTQSAIKAAETNINAYA